MTEVLDLEGGQGAGDLVQAGLVALEGLQGLVGAGQDRGRALEHVPAAADVEGDDLHRLADRDHGKPVCLATRSAVRCRVPDSVVSIEGSGSSWVAARRIRVTSRSRMIAPSILASSRSRVAENSTSSGKPPVAMESTTLVVAEHDQGAGAAAQDPLEAVAQLGAGRDGGQGRAQQLVVTAVHGNRALLGNGVRDGRPGVPAAWAQSNRLRVAREPIGLTAAWTGAARASDRRGSSAATAWRMSLTSTTCMPSGVGPPPSEPAGTTAVAKPSRAASASRRGTPVTGRISPARPDLAHRDGAPGQRPVGRPSWPSPGPPRGRPPARSARTPPTVET